MHLFKLENITVKPLLMIAEDYDHAAQIFAHDLISGLGERPDADFDVIESSPISRNTIDVMVYHHIDGS